MAFPDRLATNFEPVKQVPSSKPFDVFLVKDRTKDLRPSVLRILPDSLSSDRSAANAFMNFFTRFSEIINRAYISVVNSVSGSAGSSVYVVEEYFQGTDLRSFVARNTGQRDFDEQVTSILGKVCEALHHAHQRDIYHLCVTPEDILIDANSGKVKLVGFGVQIFSDLNQIDKLSESARKTIAPEILSGSKPRPSADVYSLARVISETCPELFKESALLSKGLSSDPSERYRSARDFEADLNHLMDDKTRTVQSRKFETPVESRGGLKPVPNNKPVVSEAPPIKADHHEDKNEPGPQNQAKTDIIPVSATSSGQKTFSSKTIIGLAASILVLAFGFGLYNHYHKQALETEQAIAAKKETDRLAALEKERLAALEREKQERERLEKEREEARIKEAERTAVFEKAQREKDAEIARLREAQKQADLEKERVEREKRQREAELERLKREQELPPIARNYPEDVKELFRKAMNGHSLSQVYLGHKYLNGDGIPHDDEEAAKWYLKAAEQGNVHGQSALGWIYENGRGLAKNYSEAVKWYLKAAESMDANARYNLASMYANGRGVAKDDAEAVKWYRKSAELRHSGAQLNLGWAYANGRGVAKDDSEAIRWYRMSAESGNAAAKQRLRQMGINP